MKIQSLFLSAALLTASTAAHDHHHHHHDHHGPQDPPPSSNHLADQAVHELERMYVEDCAADPSPHGYYGAFLQPCEFQFRQIKPTFAYTADACSDEHSTLISRPTPMHWFFNLTDRFDHEDFEFDSFSSDDIPSAEDLLLWPDQCVGVTPRCYSLQDMAPDMQDTLARIFSGGIPEEATHLFVDCRGDAVQLSRVVYSLASGLEQSAPTLIVWLITIVLVSTVLGMWCIYACLRLCCNKRTPWQFPAHSRGKIMDAECTVLGEGTEKENLLEK